MKKLLARVLTVVLCMMLLVVLQACGKNSKTATTEEKKENNNIENGLTDESEIVKSTNDESNTDITITVGDIVLEGYLNGSTPAKSLINQLPLTVTLNDSDNDFCGGNLSIDYSKNDVVSGYKDGDIAFWTPANNFVIFVSGENSSKNSGDLVNLGHITSSQELLNQIQGQINITVALKNDNAENALGETSGSADNQILESHTTEHQNIETQSQPVESASIEQVQPSLETSTEEVTSMKIKITVGNTEIYADLEDNAFTREWKKQLPITLSMSDLYGREMCYRYGAGTFPTDELRYDGYVVGDIAYWPPRGSLVILYDQNGEQFERQHVGHITSGVDVFKTTGDADVTFSVVE